MKIFKLTNSARKRGVSLIEGVLYLVIALAVIVGGIVFFQQAQLSNQVTDTARAGVAISSQTRGLYQSQRTFGENDITPALIRAGAVPSNFLNAAGDSVVHPFDAAGTITVNGNGEGFSMTITNLSEAACARLATVGEGGDGPLGTGIIGMTIAADTSTIDYTGGLAAPAAVAPVSAADVATLCVEDATNNLPDVTVFYGR